MIKKILIIAGESSGDKHAANLVTAIKEKCPTAEFFGIAGPDMRAAGVEALVKSEQMAIMGFVEVLFHLNTIRQAYQKIKQVMLERKPDLVILVDYAGFNLKVAKLAKQQNCKVLYYISPKVWAWKQGRVKLIQQYVDHMAVIFPFEVDFYKPFKVPVTYVGNPLTESVCCSESKEEARRKLGLDENKTTIALVPGSRKMEIKYILPAILAATDLLIKKHPDWQFTLPVANTLDINQIPALKELLQKSDKIKLVTQNTYLALRAADAVMCKSGTVTLETALLGTPLAVIYKMNPINYFIINYFVKIDKAGLCNLVADKFIAKELIQEKATPDAIAHEIERLVFEKNYREQQEIELQRIQQLLQGHNAARETAQLAFTLMEV